MKLPEFKRWLKEEKSEKTARAYQTDVTQFLDWLEKNDLKADDLSKDDIHAYKEHMFGRDIKSKTINRKLVSVRQYIDWLIEQPSVEMKQVPPKIKQVKIQKQEYLQDVLTKGEFDRLVAAADKDNNERAKAIFYTLLYTGARVSELVQIKIDIIQKNFFTVVGKGAKSRDIPVHKDLAGRLAPWMRERKTDPENEYLFPGHGTGHLKRQRINEIIKHYGGQARIKLSKAHPHNFRHLTAIELLKAGCDIVEVGDILGHSDPKTTAIYLRKTKEVLRNSISKL